MEENNNLTNDQVETVKSTDPSTLPNDIKTKLLAMRDTLAKYDAPDAVNTIYHILYSIASPNFDKHNPWEDLENLAECPNKGLEVNLQNDGKERRQSCEAMIATQITDTDCFCNIEVLCWGKDETETMSTLKKFLASLRQRLTIAE